jgi:hypothetical protein
MAERLEQQYCIALGQKLGDTQAETIRKIQQASGDNAMGGGGSLKLKRGSTALKMAACRRTVARVPGDGQRVEMFDGIDKVWASIMEDRRLTVREIADELGISEGSANTILTEGLGMR